MEVEGVCCEFEGDGIYVTVSENRKCAFVVCHYCPSKFKVAIESVKNNLRGNVTRHIDSSGHKENSRQSRMTQYLFSNRK